MVIVKCIQGYWLLTCSSEGSARELHFPAFHKAAMAHGIGGFLEVREDQFIAKLITVKSKARAWRSQEVIGRIAVIKVALRLFWRCSLNKSPTLTSPEADLRHGGMTRPGVTMSRHWQRRAAASFAQPGPAW